MLRKAVLEEQFRSTNLREQLRRKESSLRRTEQELDSLTFRNKQLELRVAALQEELAINEGRKQDHRVTREGRTPFRLPLKHSTTPAVESDRSHESPVIEELQKKIVENAQLTSLVGSIIPKIMMLVRDLPTFDCRSMKKIRSLLCMLNTSKVWR